MRSRLLAALLLVALLGGAVGAQAAADAKGKGSKNSEAIKKDDGDLAAKRWAATKEIQKKIEDNEKKKAPKKEGPTEASILPPKDILNPPQFVLLTHEGPLDQAAYDLVSKVTAGISNGCPIRATMFTSAEGTNCSLVSQMWYDGYEIAANTVTRPRILELNQTEIIGEVEDARAFLSDCGLPDYSLAGFRAPYLESDPGLRRALKNAKFEYDSSLVEDGEKSVTKDMTARVWPWNMATGIPIACHLYKETQKCVKGEKYPGMWEVPVWSLTAKGDRYVQNPAGAGNPYETMKANFEAAYYGNRAPFPAYVTSAWLANPTYNTAMKQFIEYASSKPDVYFVTMRQMLGWMQNPLPSPELSPILLGCNNEGGAPATPLQLKMRPPPPPRSPPPPRPPPPAPKLELPSSPELPVTDAGALGDLPPLPEGLSPGISPDPLASPDPLLGGGAPTPAPRDPFTQTPDGRPMPKSGVRIAMTVGGLDPAVFRSITEPQLLLVLKQRLVPRGADFDAFVLTVTPVPAGVTLAGDSAAMLGLGLRRRMQQVPAGQWLQVVMVAASNSTDPLELYLRARKAVSDGDVGTVLALSGGYLVPPTTVVLFKEEVPEEELGFDAAPAPAPAASPSGTGGGSGSGSGGAAASTSGQQQSEGGGSKDGGQQNLAVIVGAALGGSLLILLVAGAMYWRYYMRPAQRAKREAARKQRALDGTAAPTVKERAAAGWAACTAAVAAAAASVVACFKPDRSAKQASAGSSGASGGGASGGSAMDRFRQWRTGGGAQEQQDGKVAGGDLKEGKEAKEEGGGGLSRTVSDVKVSVVATTPRAGPPL